jgi:two-component sensor histidine kinase
MELSRASDADSLCRRAVELCILRLGFDRIGIWFFDPEDERTVVGTWGTDEHGRLRDERGIRLPRYAENHPKELREGSIPFVIIPGDVVFDDRLRPVGRSDKAITPLWDGDKIAGELIADNLFSHRPIDEEDGEILGLFARTVAHLCALKRSEAALKEALDAKALLLGELRHRTMNSFALMRSLVSIEANRVEDPALADTLRKLRDRFSVMSSLYRQLDLSAGPNKVRLDEYLRKIAIDLLDGYGAETRGVSLDCRLEATEVDMNRAVLLGLVVNELVTDSLKHAFPEGRPGRVALELRSEAERCVLRVSDDGVGLPPDFAHRPSSGLGLELVDMLCRQIDAKLDVNPGPKPSFTFCFNL